MKSNQETTNNFKYSKETEAVIKTAAKIEQKDNLIKKMDDVREHIMEAQQEAIKRDIKYNSIIINENYAETNFTNNYMYSYRGILGMNVYFTKNELPDDVSYMIFNVESVVQEKSLRYYSTNELLEELMRRNEND